MKSLRFYLLESPFPVEKTIDDYTDTEKQQFLGAFSKQVRLNRVWCVRLLVLITVDLIIAVAMFWWMRIAVDQLVLMHGLLVCAIATCCASISWTLSSLPKPTVAQTAAG